MTARDIWEIIGCVVGLILLGSLLRTQRGGQQGMDADRLGRLERRTEQLERRMDRIIELHGTGAVQTVSGPNSGSDAALADVEDLIIRGRTIDAIKLYREKAGVGLKDAKDVVERMMGDMKKEGRL